MTPYRWTADSKYLYLYPRYYPGSSGFPKSAHFHTLINSLYRINLKTGYFELVLPKDQFGVLEISPDDQYLVYSQFDEPDIIHVINLKSGNESQVDLNLEIVASGPFVWNPAGTRIVFAAAYGKESIDWQDNISASSIIVLTLKDMSTQTILYKDSRIFVPDFFSCGDGYWVDSSTICLQPLSDEYQGWKNLFTINLQSGNVKEFSIPTPTITLTPTATNTPFMTPTIPAATLSILQTLDALVTQNPDLGEYYAMMRECLIYSCDAYNLGLSPDGRWAVFFTVNEKYKNDGGLIISRLNGEKRWFIYNSDLSGDTSKTPRGVRVEHWTLDGRYVYLSPDFEEDGGYTWFWGIVRQLLRFDLETGSRVDTKMNKAFSFSPDDQYIAYRGDDGVHIYEYEMGGKVFPVPPNYVDFGKFTWSPDSKRVIFVVSFENLSDTRKKGFSSYLIDLGQNTIRTIFSHDLRYIYPISWSEPDIVIYESLDESQLYILDLETNEITPHPQATPSD